MTLQDHVRRWSDRAKRYGALAVVNRKHKKVEDFTKAQEAYVLPLLRGQLRGDEKSGLDFGCGYGRWTNTLAAMIDGPVLGVDIVPQFIEGAREQNPGKRVRYETYLQVLPLSDESTDVIWSAGALTSIPDDEIVKDVITELNRVLRRGGLLFLVENGGTLRGVATQNPYARSRTFEEYAELARPITDLVMLGWYEDLGEKHLVMAGRKC